MTSPDRRRGLLVLHVVEAYGAGVAAAVNDYIVSVPEVRHVLLAYRRPGVAISERLQVDFIDMPQGRRAQAQAVRTVIRALQPDVIHAHSSLAGAYVRLGSRRRGARVVYSPHCYAFERRDVAEPVRAAFWAMEALMALRTDGVAAVGDRERSLATQLPRGDRSVLVPHRHRRQLPLVDNPCDGPVVAVGRVEPQKDPGFFAAAARDARLLGCRREWRWVGGGDEALEAMLRAAGVTVTGWKPREAVWAELAAAHVYVHTAAWEGNPISVLEASSVGLPVVARDIPSLHGAGAYRLASNPIELAQGVLELEDDQRWWTAAERSARSVADGDAEAQAEALRRLYRVPAGTEVAGAAA